MKVFRRSIDLKSELGHPIFHDITKQVKHDACESDIKSVIYVAYSHHTTRVVF